jgi:hypothetical protein
MAVVFLIAISDTSFFHKLFRTGIVRLRSNIRGKAVNIIDQTGQTALHILIRYLYYYCWVTTAFF